MEALQLYEELLLLQKKFLPLTAGQIPKTCEEIVILCNILGMVYLKKGTARHPSGREFPDVARLAEEGRGTKQEQPATQGHHVQQLGLLLQSHQESQECSQLLGVGTRD